MRWTATAGLLLCLQLAPGCLGALPAGEAPAVRGPLAARVMHPILLTQLPLAPRRAAIQPGGTWGGGGALAYMSIFERRSRDGERVVFDGEQLRTRFMLRRGVGASTDVEGELAATFASSGFLDDFVNEFHDLFGFPGGGRENAENDQFDAIVRKDGELAYRLEEDRVGLGDVPIIVNTALRAEDPEGPAVALRLGVELPLGSEQRGFGNGGVDFGGGLIAERSWSRWSVFGGVNWIVPHEPSSFRDAGISLNNRVELQLGGELRWNAATSFLLQLNWIGPITSDLDLEELNREILDIGLGVAWDVAGGRCSLSFHEDAVAATGADFGVRVALDWGA